MTKQNLACVLGIFSLLGASAAVMADPPAAAPPAPVAPDDAATAKAKAAVLNAQPSLLEGLQIQSGLTFRLRQPVGTIGYYKIVYKDQMLGQHGEATNRLDATHQFTFSKPDEAKPVTTTDAADTPRFLLDLTSGKGDLSGALFNALGVNSFLAPKLNLGPFRTAGQLSGRFDGREIDYALSIESPTVHPLSYAGIPHKANIANWLVVGFGGEQQYQHGLPNAVNQVTAQLTYRSFIGKATRWRPSKTRTVPFSAADITSAYKTKEALAAQGDVLAARGDQAPRTLAEDFILQLSAEFTPPTLPGGHPPPPGKFDPGTPAGYRAYVQDAYERYSAGYLTEPTYGVWLENTGQYKFTGDPQGDRFKYALAVVLSYWRDFGPKARSQFQLRYESGYDYGSQQERFDRVLLTAGLNF